MIVCADGFTAQGSFAQAQAEYLDPDPDRVARLDGLLRTRKAGVVAHFYMDAELQGALYACTWPHIQISDSLVMADRACEMAEAGAEEIVVLGVDFMSENVRAMLDASGLNTVGCWRVSEDAIGCSLAESAEALAYGAWLDRAARTPKSLHVVYINTSLRTKARAHHKVPTITCTSSNVVATVLQAFAQEPETSLWFGPDTYMGENLERLFTSLAELEGEAGAAKIRALHPAHTQASIADLLTRFHYFRQGNCVVHHMFGADVARRVERDYYDAAGSEVHITAHLEVPGEMFELALRAQREGRGVVGSTKNILDHISACLDAALIGGGGQTQRLRFVLGTEAGMVTAIVRSIRAQLAQMRAGGGRAGGGRAGGGRAGGGQAAEIEVEIIFPVAAEAVASTGDEILPLVPGVPGGEGCSTAGGCATCPYMKMNSMDALIDLLERLPEGEVDAELRAGRRAELIRFEPEKYAEQIAGRSVASLGTEPILHMRGFQRSGRLPEALVADMRAR